MKKRSLAWIGAALLLLFLAIPGYSQFTGSGRDYIRVTFQASVRGATVFINNSRIGVTPLTIGLKPGTYNLRVAKAGAGEFSRRITVRKVANQVFRATLRQTTERRAPVSVTTNTNVSKITAFLNDKRFEFELGSPLRIPPGSYQLRLEAEGFMPLNTTLNVTNQREQSYSFTLQPETVAVRITTNVGSAMLILNNQQRGKAQSVFKLKPGQYQLRLEAEGFTTLNTTLNVTNQREQSYSFTLQPRMAQVTLTIPDRFRESGVPHGPFKLYLDGKEIKIKRDLLQFQAAPGQHTIRLSFPGAGLSITRQFLFEIGQNYKIEFVIDLIMH